jgi:phosphoribosylamine--glycine ligase
MRFLGIGDSCDLGALYMRLVADGHEVRTYVGEPLAHGTMAGLVERVADWEAELDWIGAAGEDGIILFENVAKSRGQLQDRLRKDGFNVIGGSAYGDRLENDRAFGQRILAGIGLQTARVEEFTSLVDAEHFLAQYPGRYVLKFNGANFGSRDNYVGRLSSGLDALAVLQSKAPQLGDGGNFILMEHVEGVEMGVGAYFDGQSFVGRPCLDWEHKRFFPGNLGELTGEMGTIATFDRSEVFFERTLKPMAPLLSAGGYCGYVNLNTIVNRSGIWPLEFTCRFGYPGFAVLGPLQETHWADLFAAMTGRPGRVQMRPGFCAAVVLTTPPFPYDRKAVDEPVGLPVIFDGGLTPDELEGLYYGEVGVSNGRLVTSGQYGWTMVATGTGTTIGAAREGAVALADKVVVPNLRYRRDIGCSLIDRDFAQVDDLGLLG